VELLRICGILRGPGDDLKCRGLISGDYLRNSQGKLGSSTGFFLFLFPTIYIMVSNFPLLFANSSPSPDKSGSPENWKPIFYGRYRATNGSSWNDQ